MKICILATGRCGSTSLYSCIKEHLNDEYVFLEEPLDRYKKTKKNLAINSETPNILLKTLVGQVPIENDVNQFYDWIFQSFDKVIILDRKNRKEQVESFAYHTTKNIRDKHNIKRIYYLDSIPSDVINEWDANIKIASDLLNQIALNYNSKIYYYEDIFVDKNMLEVNEIFDYLKIEPVEEILNRWIISDDKKVRIYKKIGKII